MSTTYSQMLWRNLTVTVFCPEQLSPRCLQQIPEDNNLHVTLIIIILITRKTALYKPQISLQDSVRSDLVFTSLNYQWPFLQSKVFSLVSNPKLGGIFKYHSTKIITKTCLITLFKWFSSHSLSFPQWLLLDSIQCQEQTPANSKLSHHIFLLVYVDIKQIPVTKKRKGCQQSVTRHNNSKHTSQGCGYTEQPFKNKLRGP